MELLEHLHRQFVYTPSCAPPDSNPPPRISFAQPARASSQPPRRGNISAMKKFAVLIPVLLGAVIGLGADDKKLPSMPAAVSGNADASLNGGLELFSIM